MGLWKGENEVAVKLLNNLTKQNQWMFSSGIAEGGIVSQGTNIGTFKVTEITKAILRTSASSIAPFDFVTFPEQDNQTIPMADIVYFVVFIYGNPCTISLSETTPNGFNAIPIGKVSRNSSNEVHYISGGYRFGSGVSKLHKRAMSLRSLELKHGSNIAYSGTNNFTLTQGIAFGGVNEYFLSSYNSANTQFTAIYKDGAGGWIKVKRNTIDYAHYDDGSGILSNIRNNKYGAHYIFKHIDSQAVYVVYGLGSYSLAESILQASQVPEIPLHLLSFGCFLGSIVVPQNGGSFTKILSPLDQFFDSTEVANHANLSNLTYVDSGHTGFANANINTGENDNIKSMTGLNSKGIPASKINGFPSANIQTLTDETNISWDVSKGAFATITLLGSRTLNNPTNVIPGSVYKLKVVQDSTGGRILSFESYFKFSGGTPPTLSSSAGAVDLFEFIAYSNIEIILVNFLSDIK